MLDQLRQVFGPAAFISCDREREKKGSVLEKMGKKIGRDLGDSINAVYNHEGQSGEGQR